MANPLDQIVFRELSPGDSISAITRLLHAAYAQLADMGFRYLATHQNDATTEQRLNKGYALVADLNGDIVATVTLYSHDPTSDCEWYRRPDVCHFGQFGVQPALQRSGIGRRLVEMLEDHARKLHASELALDTAEEATHLVDWYGRMGYRWIETVSWDVTNYRSVIMSKRL